jgi:hypothetical protein
MFERPRLCPVSHEPRVHAESYLKRYAEVPEREYDMFPSTHGGTAKPAADDRRLIFNKFLLFSIDAFL